MRLESLPRDLRSARAAIAERLRLRRVEIEEAVRLRICGIDSASASRGTEYIEGLRESLAIAIEYAITAVEKGDSGTSTPPTLVTQARLAASAGVSLDTVLRRYFAGYAVLGEYVMQEADSLLSSQGLSVHWLLQGHNDQFDELIAAVSEEYGRERERLLRSSEHRQTERVEKLLAGASVDRTSFDYDFEGWHVGVVAAGTGLVGTVQELARSMGVRILLVKSSNGTTWAWLASSHELDSGHVHESFRHLSDQPVGIGEAADGLHGWRESHKQAKACLPIASRRQTAVRYREVAVLASILQDELLYRSLRRLYLQPLMDSRNGSDVLRETLRAYLRAERNVSSAAALLGVSRTTVTSRLRSIEERLGTPLTLCPLELEALIQLDEYLNDAN